MKTKECPHCSRKITVCNFSRHQSTCDGTYFTGPNKPKNRKTRTREEVLSQLAATRTRKSRVSWNKGLTAATDERVANGINTRKENIKSGKTVVSGRPHSDKTRRLISEIRKRYIEEHPDQVPWLISHSSKISYPEQYFIQCFSEISGLVFQHPVSRFRLDFANIVSKRYIEIDGEQHYSSDSAIERDAIRTSVLTELGWVGTRVRWSEFRKLTTALKMEQVGQLIKFIQ